jgi:dienelactone hydrolase
MRFVFCILLLCVYHLPVFAQKKPLDHSVYDDWQSIGQKLISNDGKWVAYTIDVQEGDNQLVVQSTTAEPMYKKVVPRGYNAVITQDSRFVIFRIKPHYKDLRAATRRKAKSDDLPKDSLGIIELGKDSVVRIAKVNGYRVPGKSAGWLAYQVSKESNGAKTRALSGEAKRINDSLVRVIDSLRALIPKSKARTRDEGLSTESGASPIDDRVTDFADEDSLPGSAVSQFDLRLRNLYSGEEKTLKNVVEYLFSEKGSKLLVEQFPESTRKRCILLYDLAKGLVDTLSRGGNDFKNFAVSENGEQVAYLAERDAKPKDLEKYYKLWYYKEGMDSAIMLVDKHSIGMKLGMTISENGTPAFSKSGSRVFFGVAPIEAPKDTSLAEADLVKLDVWHYNDDYLQTVQLNRLSVDSKRHFLGVINLQTNAIQQLASEDLPLVYQTGEGDGDVFVGVSDAGKRIGSQWTGYTEKDIYAIDVNTAKRTLIKKDLIGIINPSYVSPGGKYIMWYDYKAEHYFVYDGHTTRNITAKIKTSLSDEEYDSPGNPSPYGIMGWREDDSLVYIYDRYDVWQVDPSGKANSVSLTSPGNTGFGRKQNNSFRYLRTDPDELRFHVDQPMYFRMFNHVTKKSAIVSIPAKGTITYPELITEFSNHSYSGFNKAKDEDAFIYTRESYYQSPDLYFVNTVNKEISVEQSWHIGGPQGSRLSFINPQQKEYNWGTAELYKWKTFKGKSSEGILYKPENFDPSKKYPLILYFYEKLSDGLHTYHPPAPTPSRLNISFFVSRGYLVFAPNISYTIGHPAQSAYDYIVSAAKDLTKHRWVDAGHIGIQGQSWGGIQVAQLITMTDMFKAAWAGAPVANMTSAYGGIRWESGANRQFQYEKTQSRIGATLWEKPELYIENSPLFHLPKVKTPLVIMANDADGAVPWYQGIELFTGMRRLGKKVWMLNYNGEAHNLIQRRNRKDIQIREQQFFDWLLKGEKPAKWLTDGVPAVKKGKDWGLELVD